MCVDSQTSPLVPEQNSRKSRESRYPGMIWQAIYPIGSQGGNH